MIGLIEYSWGDEEERYGTYSIVRLVIGVVTSLFYTPGLNRIWWAVSYQMGDCWKVFYDKVI